MRIPLCLILFMLWVQTAFSIPVWVENNCTLDRNSLIIKADETSGSLKIKSFRNDDSGDEVFFKAIPQEDHHTHHEWYPQHPDATLLASTDRSIWIWYLLKPFHFPSRSFYQSIEAILNTPPPQS